MSAITTRAPSSTNTSVIARPIPFAPPVTTATLPSSSLLHVPLPDVHRVSKPRDLGAASAARQPAVPAVRSGRATFSFEPADEVLDLGLGLLVADVHAEGLLDEHEPRDARQHQDDDRSGPLVGVDPVALEDLGQGVELGSAEPPGVVGDLVPDDLAVVGQGDELHRRGRVRPVVDQVPEAPQRLRRPERLAEAFEAAFGATSEEGDEHPVERPEVVRHQGAVDPCLLRHATGRRRGVALGEHEVLGRVEQRVARRRVAGVPSPSGHRDAVGLTWVRAPRRSPYVTHSIDMRRPGRVGEPDR